VANDQENERAEGSAKISNAISDETGQFDARFTLWRMFCAENNISVETLPGDLSGDAKEKWEKMKEMRLDKPTDDTK
jgi:hypothetical protein